ncbi:nucleoid-associated protein Lsr2 [Micromonospora tulbaghiae]|uniref:Nucleoid-associated protein Lsr2 n=1 Tax=Micromonospora tulbaghiae TaxID=479978 RepID=A0A386WH14_9ACTN|nr:Lsr2 family protein [Micromonospora tulbaghiae]AYF26789.1 nucleoid-associated protein Lsr2 [Micromonospora tulbaghiae]
MVRKMITVLTDDLDGTAADRTVEFSLDGDAYTIDLSDQNAGALRKALDMYIVAGRRMGRGAIDAGSARRAKRPAIFSSSRAHTRAIREWAAENGYQVSERGRIPTSVAEAYNNR